MTTHRTPGRAARRGGTTLPEVALLMAFFLMFLFGVLEYSRYLMALHVVTNAARDGARYAAVNVDKGTDFDYKDATVYPTGDERNDSVWKHTVKRMGGADRMIRGLTVATFPCDDEKLYLASGPVVAVKPAPTTTPTTHPYKAPTASNYQTGSAITPALRVYWNQASFTERIAVRVSGTYEPILPSFLFMAGTAKFEITMLAGSEG